MKYFTLRVKMNPTEDVNPIDVRIIVGNSSHLLNVMGSKHSSESVLPSYIYRKIILAATILGATQLTGSNRFGYLRQDRTLCDYKDIELWSWLEAKYFNACIPTQTQSFSGAGVRPFRKFGI